MDTTRQSPESEQIETAAGEGSEEGLLAWLVARGLIPETSPKRAFAAATFVNQIGKGLFIAGSALFFTRSVGLPVTQVGFGLGAAALIGLTAGIPVGRLADRRSPREVFRVAVVVQALAVGALFLVAGQVIPLVVNWSDRTRMHSPG